MIQVWLLDNKGFYQNESKDVKEIVEGMTTVPLLVGYVRPKLVNNEWVEGATEEEIAEYKANKIDNCTPKTTEQKLEELVTQVTVMDQIIANLTLEVL